jgi:hypothetical protein
MQHWTIEAAEVWEDLLDMPYGQFFDHYQDTKARRVKDLAAILVANDFNNDSTIDVKAHYQQIKKLPMETLYTRISAMYEQAPAAKKKTAQQAT